MSYQKQAWRDYDDTKTELQNLQNGAVVTPERLNHIETGIANSANKEEVTAQLAQKAEQEALEVEKNRIDTIVSLPDGSTTNDARLEDITVADDGEVYDSPGNAVRGQVSKVKANINDYKNLIGDKTVNMFDKSTITQGKYYSGSIGETPILTDNADYYCFILNVEPSAQYRLSGIDTTVKLTNDADTIVMTRGTGSAQHDFLLNTFGGATKAYISVSINHVHPDNYMAVKGDTLPDNYVHYGVNLSDETKNEVRKLFAKEGTDREIYTVGSDKDYMTFTACIEALQGNDNPKTIEIDAGTYDIFQELGGKTFVDSIPSGADWRDVSVIVPDNTRIVGKGIVKFEFLPTSSDITLSASRLLSPINIVGNVELENITIDADRCRYGIHDDGSSDVNQAGAIKRYKDVRVKKRSSDGYGYEQAFGGGAFDRMEMYFDECIFDCNTLPFSIHNNATTDPEHGYKAVMSNCAFITEDETRPSVRFGNIDWREALCDIKMYNCYLNSHVQIYPETDYAIQNHKLTMIRCGNPDVQTTLNADKETVNPLPEVIYG